MKATLSKKILAISFFIALAFEATPQAWADTFFGERPTGLIKLDEYRYPVYLYVPEITDSAQLLPLIISLPGDGENPKKHIESWASFAKQKNLIVFTPEIKLRYTDVPYQTDIWLIRIKNDVVRRYQVASNKIFLVGTGNNAHYAGYLGAKYPKEFSAAALLGGSWVGPLEGLIPVESRPVKQLPFFVSLMKESGPTVSATQRKADELMEKGYPVNFEVIDEQQTFSKADFRQRMIGWLNAKSQTRELIVQKSEKSWKERLHKGIENFFEV